MTLAAERLGARIGLIAVLHTWGQTLTHHPHVHCLVPGGGVALDGQRWVACKPNFLLSVHALSKTFRRLFLDGLAAAFRRGELGFFGDLAPLADPAAFAERVRALRQSPFVVYAKPPFGGPERVLAYLARYTHRTAIANSRLVAVDDDEVAFSYKDYRRGGREPRHAACPARVHPPLSPPRPARRLPPHPALRLPRQGRPRREPRARARPGERQRPPPSPPTARRGPPTLNLNHSRTTGPSLRARTAAASCAASASSRRRPAPFAATRHDDDRSPDLDPVRPSSPPLHGAAGARLHAPSPVRVRLVRPPRLVVRAVQAPDDCRPVVRRSTAAAFPSRRARRLRQDSLARFPHSG